MASGDPQHGSIDSDSLGRPIRLGGAVLSTHRHMCAFFALAIDEYRVLLPFIKDGFEGGEKAVHIIDPGRRGDHSPATAG